MKIELYSIAWSVDEEETSRCNLSRENVSLSHYVSTHGGWRCVNSVGSKVSSPSMSLPPVTFSYIFAFTKPSIKRPHLTTTTITRTTITTMANQAADGVRAQLAG